MPPGSAARTKVDEMIDTRRMSVQHRHDTVMRQRAADRIRYVGILVPAALGWTLNPQGGWAAVMILFTIVAVIVSCASIGFALAAFRRIGRRVIVMSVEGNDPTGLVPALDVLIDALRSPSSGRSRTLAAYEAVIDRMQSLVPGHPLSRLVARGYRPSKATNEHNHLLRYDEDPDERHWERAMEAIDDLRTMLTSENWITERDVLDQVSELVAPLRAVLRARDVPTWRIEYDAPSVAIARRDARNGDDALLDVLPPPPPRSFGTSNSAAPPLAADAITPIENRLNATAAMTIASLRPLATAFRSADPNLFLGDDRSTGESMIESHLPRLVDAFVIADDASSGPERDAVRAEFARSLGFLRDSMAGIMERHVQATRENLQVQARFVEIRHGRDESLP